MNFRAMCVALLAIIPAAGCGTVANLARPGPEAGGKTPFGGVGHDVRCLQNVAKVESEDNAHPKLGSDHYPHGVLLVLCAVDLPFSLIGDVITWPYTAAYSCINQPTPTPPVRLLPTESQPQTSPPEPLPIPRKLP